MCTCAHVIDVGTSHDADDEGQEGRRQTGFEGAPPPVPAMSPHGTGQARVSQCVSRAAPTLSLDHNLECSTHKCPRNLRARRA